MTDRSNFLFILADDLGYSDVGCFGGEIATPAIDALATRGVRQTQFYNCARCCPSRASLMTGLYPHRAGVGAMVNDEGHPAYRGFIRPDMPTLAERLRAVGYATWMSGKWHCGGEYAVHRPDQWQQAGDETHPLPTQRGFQRFYGTLGGGGSYFDPCTLVDDGRFVYPRDLPADYYLTDAIGTHAERFVADAVTTGEPWFGYLAFTAPHWPLHARAEDIAAYRGRYGRGWDELRRSRLARMVAMGVLPATLSLSPRDPDSPPWEEADDPAWRASLMEVYAAQVTAMDRAIGRVIEAVRAVGQLDDTLVVFLSDNGGCAEFLREDGPAGTWPEFYSLPTKRGTMADVGNVRGRVPGSDETFMSYELPWANASNTPFRKFKAWTHEGGISTPLVACWPRQLPAGAIRPAVGHLVDLVATACVAAGADASGLDGVDLRPVWRGEQREASRPEPLCWEHFGHAAIREGRWKLVRADLQAPWELYDMDTDRIEQNDLAASDPLRVDALQRKWLEWAKRCGVRLGKATG